MKLVSIKRDGRDTAGVLLGDQVLDVNAYVRSSGESPAYWYKDALDLLDRGEQWLWGVALSSDSNWVRDYETIWVSAAEAKFNPPVLAPGKILAVGLNYAAHAAEQNKKPPETPLIFTKCVTALVGDGDEIRLPRVSEQVDYEAELAVVIGREARSVSAADAMDYVAGYTIMNDVTARDLQSRERQWTRAKGLDTFAPCGPCLVTRDEIADPHALDLWLTVNGEIRQQSNTSDLIFKIPELIEFISQDLTLRPGDIISTGTPSGVGVYRNPQVFLKAGDEIEVHIAGIGKLSNRVAA